MSAYFTCDADGGNKVSVPLLFKLHQCGQLIFRKIIEALSMHQMSNFSWISWPVLVFDILHVDFDF